ncbi:anaerobic ribonucleoside-triphosphate reductase activating protein [Desulfotomaculum arcticum]|uniref:Anaerobic ribonucleoside-triphosphate reductase-activating protein n=1 Tax=Desulfotruncus arcticus DSM 17038 TaxID=1121424 RepID=A0A1I2T5V9_9FIRM|nr:anaerobic ribonucleoside-triphosphate reductase activating protein [Desulfotruncus arcticus]SFG58587.1 anaerobic ribonucleoside-triphosphate reductase activating protein [Desulfotomaculum arcticum] [Desulfotruncus arcticus DSM 17038]
MKKLRISGFIRESVVDGPGFRLVIFTQGCPRQCPGCHNPDLIPTEGGQEVGSEDVLKLVDENITPLTKGITISGGDPLMQSAALAEVLPVVRDKYPKLDIWAYTGYTFEQVKDLPAMKYIDVLVDGAYEQDKRDLNLAFRGSANQRIINVPKSLRHNEAVVLDF